MLTIYGSDLSGPANKVRFVANYLKIPYEYRRVNLAEGEQKKEWFLKINPIGKIPAMDDEGFYLFESGAIVKYLCGKAPSSLYPEDIKQKAIVDQWIDFSSLHIGVNVSKVVYNRFFAPRRGWPISQESIADGEKFLGQYLPLLDNHLGQFKFLAGAQMTLADMTLLSSLDPCEVANIDLKPYNNLTAWRNYLKTLDFYTQCHKEYAESFKQAPSK